MNTDIPQVLDRKLSEKGIEPPARQPFVTIDDCIQSGGELLTRLGVQLH
jgi:hypothetical protein